MKYLLDTCVLSELAAFDSIIAATARKHGCHLVIRNIRDFAHAGLDLLNPWESA